MAWLRHGLLEKTSVQERVISLVNFFDKLIPGTANQLSHLIYDRNQFPWRAVKTELIAYGTGAAVFKIEWDGGHKVLRLYRRSIDKSISAQMSIVEHYKQNYESVFAWYGGVPELVLPMAFLVLECSPLIGPMAASLQPYIDGDKYDLFDDYSDNELLRLLEGNVFLRKQFIYFAEQTLRQWRGGKICYDFLGRENVMLVRHNEEYRIHIVDNGFFVMDGTRYINPEKMARLEKRIKRLNSLFELCKSLFDGD